MNEEKCASFACTQRCSSELARWGMREELLGRIVHHRRLTARVGDDDGVGHRVDDEVHAVALGARLNLRRAELAVVLFDFLGRPPQIGDVSENRHDAGAVPRILGDRAEQLEQQVRSIGRVDEEQLATRRARLLDRLAREGRRQQHVVHPHRAAAALALFLRRREQRERARIGDQQAPFRVRQQNRIGDGVDDAVQEPALAPLLAIALGKRPLPQDLIELLAEDRGEPLELRHGAVRARDQQQAERTLLGRRTRETERHGVERGILERRRRTPAPIGGRVRRREVGMRAVERRDQRIAPVVEGDRERRDDIGGQAARCHGAHEGLANRPDEADRLLNPG